MNCLACKCSRLPKPGAPAKTLVQAGHVTFKNRLPNEEGAYQNICLHIQVTRFKCNVGNMTVVKNNINFVT